MAPNNDTNAGERRPRVLGERLAGSPVTRADETAVSVVMNRHIRQVRPADSVQRAGRLLLEDQISGAPVVDEAGHPVGVISHSDLLRHYVQGSEVAGVGWEEAAERLGYEAYIDTQHEQTVGEVMTPIAFTLPENAPLSQAAALMAYERVHRIVVVDAANCVSGIVSAVDILRWLAASSGFELPLEPEPDRG